MNFFIKMNIKNEQRRQEKCDAGQRKSNHNRHLRRASRLVAYEVVGTYEVFSTQHERKEVGHESPAYGSRQRGVRRVAGVDGSTKTPAWTVKERAQGYLQAQGFAVAAPFSLEGCDSSILLCVVRVPYLSLLLYKRVS